LPQEIALPQLLELVKTLSPSLQAERTRVQMAQADLMTARTLPNPRASYTHQRYQNEVSLSQDLPIFGQRSSTIDAAKSGIESARADLRLVYAQALQDAARDFMALLVSQEREKRWVDARNDLESALRIVEGQVQAGARSQYDLTRLEVERATLASQLAQAQADTQQAAAEVAGDVGAPAWRPRAQGNIVTHFDPVNADALWQQAQSRLPQVRAALAQQEFAEKQLAAEKKQAIPVPTVMLGHLTYQGQAGGMEAGVSVGIPLFDRNQGPISHAAAEADGARLRSQATVIAAENELRRAAEQLNKREQLASRFEQDGLSMVPRLRQMAQDSYTLGRGSILDLVDAIQAVAEKKNAYLDLLQATMQAEVDLRVASGELGADLLDQ
jgi:cobalt-zinc-cadmium efflux system outer membrane protein